MVSSNTLKNFSYAVLILSGSLKSATSNTINNSSKQIDDIIDSIIKSNEESQQKISELITLLKTSKPENKGKIRVLLEHIKDTQSLYASFFNFIGKMWGTN